MTAVQYIDRPGRLLPPAIALLGNEREGAAFDFVTMQGYVRDRATPGNFALGDLNSILTYASPSPKWITNAHGVLESGSTLRCDHDPATLDTSSTPLNSLGLPMLRADGRWYVRKSLTTTGAVDYVAGSHVRATLTSDISKWMLGRVVSYDAGALVLDVYASSGYVSGDDWTIIGALGVLIEEQRTNLITNSAIWAGWGEATQSAPGASIRYLQANAAVAPDGTLTAYKLVESTDYDQQRIYLATATAIGLSYSWSVYIKAGERTVAQLRTSSGSRFMMVDLTTGAILSQNALDAAEVKRCSGGWWRLAMTFTASVNPEVPWVELINGASSTYAGDGASGFYVWQPQFEAGRGPSSAMPTGSSSVTRLADNVRMLLSELPDISGGWSYSVRVGLPLIESSLFEIQLSSSAAANRNAVYRNSTGAISSLVTTGGASQGGNTRNPFAATDLRVAGRSFADDLQMALNGDLAPGDTEATLPDVDLLRIGSLISNQYHLNEHIRELVITSSCWSDAEILARTTS